MELLVLIFLSVPSRSAARAGETRIAVVSSSVSLRTMKGSFLLEAASPRPRSRVVIFYHRMARGSYRKVPHCPPPGPSWIFLLSRRYRARLVRSLRNRAATVTQGARGGNMPHQILLVDDERRLREVVALFLSD